MDHSIPLTEAAAMTARYRKHHELILQPDYQNRNILPLAESFERAAIERLLQQEGCAGIRIYYGMKEDDSVHAILVGYNARNEDLVPQNDTATTADEGDIIDRSIRCPPYCAPTSPLNS